MASEQSGRAAITTPFALALARRAILIAILALVAAVVALVAALWGGSEGDSVDSAVLEQAQIDAAAAQAEAEDAANMATASASSAARAEEAAVVAQEAAAMAQDAVVMAQGAVAAAREAAVVAQDAAAMADVSATVALTAVEASAGGVQVSGGDTAEGDAPEVDDGLGDSTSADAPPEDTEEAAVAASDTTPEDTDEAEDVTEPVSADPTDALPGEPYEFGPSAGAGLAVVGVSFDSALNVRDVPAGEIIARLDNLMDGVRDPVVVVRGPDSDDIIATLDLQQGVVATGNTRKLPTTIWSEIRLGEIVGWASGAYLAPLGSSRDATAEVVEALGGTPTADTLSGLGLQVAGVFSSSGEVQSRTTVASRPGVFEAVGNITLDVLGLSDDAVAGYRVNVTADAGAEDDPGPFTLRSVTVTPICDSARGVSEEGLCH